MVLLFYTTYISVDLAHHKIFNAKVCKGGIKYIILCVLGHSGTRWYGICFFNASRETLQRCQNHRDL